MPANNNNHAPVTTGRYPLSLIAAISITLFLIFTVTLLGSQTYRGFQAALIEVTGESVVHVADALQLKARSILLPSRDKLRTLVYSGIGSATTLERRLTHVPMMREILEQDRLLDAVYAGYPDGAFVLFRALRSTALRNRFDAPATAELLVQSITPARAARAAGEYRFYDAQGTLIQTRAMPEYRYDPRTRPWYQKALQSNGPIITDPYLFFTTKAIGVTMSRQDPSTGAVFGLDATLESLARELSAFRITPSTEIALMTESGQIFGYSDLSRMLIPALDGGYKLATLQELSSPALEQAALVGGVSDTAQMIGAEKWLLAALPIDLHDGTASKVLMAIPEREMFASARSIVELLLVTGSVILACAILLGLVITQRFSRPLRRLADETNAIMAFDFSSGTPLRSRIKEVDQLATSIAAMKETISRFLETSVTLNSEQELGTMMDHILMTLVESTRCNSGAVYLYDETRHTLELTKRRGLLGSSGKDLFPDRLDLNDHADQHPAVRAALLKSTAGAKLPPPAGSVIATPLITRNGDLVGVVVLEILHGFSSRGRRDPIIGFIEALSGMAAVAIETRQLIEAQKNLLDGFIKILAGAIDAKSPYTGGHCQRVPELSQLLAEAAHQASEGPFAAFNLSDVDREALYLGSWLHDCGKVTTPEYVVDKATKLETIYNRIHEIRTRFEVLKRDAEIAYLEACLEGADRDTAQRDMLAMKQRLDEEFAFVAECNVGGESMDDARIERLRAIASRTWMRTIDNHLGLSWDERARMNSSGKAALPVEERLLADAPEHIIARGPTERIPEDNPWGFKMQAPELKYNRGELYNLSIRRGTLTAEERYVINDHIMQTIIMLGKLPFPHHLRDVPEIAGGHHERMDGKGYPKQLQGSEMSVMARIMAIADVFEALTACDRPYKRAHSLSKALGIMNTMVQEHHLDGDLFDLFLRSGVYKVYAERYLLPEQIDKIDPEAYLLKH